MFTTGSDAERLVARNKDLMDNATPGANSLAAVGLLRLAALTGEPATAPRRGDPAAGWAAGHPPPTAFGHLLVAVDMAVSGLDEIVVAGDRPDLVAEVHRPGASCRAGLGRAVPLAAVGGRSRRRRPAPLRVPGYACKLPAEDAAALCPAGAELPDIAR